MRLWVTTMYNTRGVGRDRKYTMKKKKNTRQFGGNVWLSSRYFLPRRIRGMMEKNKLRFYEPRDPLCVVCVFRGRVHNTRRRVHFTKKKKTPRRIVPETNCLIKNHTRHLKSSIFYNLFILYGSKRSRTAKIENIIGPYSAIENKHVVSAGSP